MNEKTKELMTAAAHAVLDGSPDRVELAEKALRSLSKDAARDYGKPMSGYGKGEHLSPLPNTTAVDVLEKPI